MNVRDDCQRVGQSLLQRGLGTALRGAGLLAALLLLGACEAPLKLEAVEQRRAEAVHRTDLFQAADSNGESIVVVGNQGTIVYSLDQGANWNRVRLPGWPPLIDVAACPDGRYAALAPGGRVLVSADNGATWEGHAIETEEAAQDITCDPRNRIWVVGSFSSLFNSEDGGETWSVDSSQEDLIYTNIQFVDEQVAYVAGEFGTVIRSDDAGETWEPLPLIPDDFYPQYMLFTDADTGWLAGLGGTILHTTDGGITWARQPTSTAAPVYGLVRVGEVMYAVGGEGALMRLVDGSWKRVRHDKPIRLFLRATEALGDSRLLIGGREGVLHILPVGDLPLVAKS